MVGETVGEDEPCPEDEGRYQTCKNVFDKMVNNRS